MHHRWKRFAVEQCELKPGDIALDICCGTGDLAILLTRKVGPSGKVLALDFCAEMIELARRKAIGVKSSIDFTNGNAEDLKIASSSVNAAIIGFGLRNVNSIERVLQEMHRVLEAGGRAVCLEFSHPRLYLLRVLYDFYSFQVIPRAGKLISKNSNAYVYLPESIRSFPDQESLRSLMAEQGFEEVKYYNLMGGMVAVHVGVKR